MDRKLIILSAPSGTGKTTIARHLLNGDLNLGFSISACSRDKRAGEVDGKDYYFLTIPEFREKISAGDFLEWEEVYPNHLYGTLRSEVDRIHQLGRHVLFDVDVIGGVNIKKIYGSQALALFICPPSLEVLRSRLEKRSADSPEKIQMRLQKAETEMKWAKKFDQILVNDDLEKTVEKIKEVLKFFLYGSVT